MQFTWINSYFIILFLIFLSCKESKTDEKKCIRDENKSDASSSEDSDNSEKKKECEKKKSKSDAERKALASKDNFLNYSDPYFTIKADVSELKNHLRSSEKIPLVFDFVGGWEIDQDGIVETEGHVESSAGNKGQEEHTLKGCAPAQGFAYFYAEMSVVDDALLIAFDRGSFDRIGKLDIEQILGVGEYAPRHINEEFGEIKEDGDGGLLALEPGPSCFQFLYDYQNNDYFAGSTAALPRNAKVYPWKPPLDIPPILTIVLETESSAAEGEQPEYEYVTSLTEGGLKYFLLALDAELAAHLKVPADKAAFQDAMKALVLKATYTAKK